MAYDLVIREGIVVAASETYSAGVAHDGEAISTIGSDFDGARTIDAKRRLPNRHLFERREVSGWPRMTLGHYEVV